MKQLLRDHNLLTNQEGNDNRKMNELNNLVKEVSDGSVSTQENDGRFVNFRDCRPSAKLKAAGKKKDAKGGVNGNPLPNASQQNIMTNTLIKEKLKDKDSLSIGDASARHNKTLTHKKKSQMRVGDTCNSFRSGTTQHSTAAKGGVVKTIVLPHEDLNRLGTDGQLLVQVLEQ